MDVLEVLPDGVGVEGLALGLEPIERGIHLDVVRGLLQLRLVLDDLDPGVQQCLSRRIHAGGVRWLDVFLEQLVEVFLDHEASYLAPLEQVFQPGDRQVLVGCSLWPAVSPRTARPGRSAGSRRHGSHSSFFPIPLRYHPGHGHLVHSSRGPGNRWRPQHDNGTGLCRALGYSV